MHFAAEGLLKPQNRRLDRPHNLWTVRVRTYHGSGGRWGGIVAGAGGAPQTQKSTMGPCLTETLLEAYSAQREQLLDKMFQHESETLDEQQQHAREIHSTILSSQERIAKNMANSHERIAASSEPTM